MWRHFMVFPLLFLSLSAHFANGDLQDVAVRDPVSITYTLWIGTDIEIEHRLSLTVAADSTFFEVMKVAAEKDSTFAFSSEYFPDLGNFITEIAGVAGDQDASTFWMIYILPDVPDRASPPSDDYLSNVGVDLITVQDGKNYLFWYKYVDWSDWSERA